MASVPIADVPRGGPREVGRTRSGSGLHHTQCPQALSVMAALTPESGLGKDRYAVPPSPEADFLSFTPLTLAW